MEALSWCETKEVEVFCENKVVGKGQDGLVAPELQVAIEAASSAGRLNLVHLFYYESVETFESSRAET